MCFICFSSSFVCTCCAASQDRAAYTYHTCVRIYFGECYFPGRSSVIFSRLCAGVGIIPRPRDKCETPCALTNNASRTSSSIPRVTEKCRSRCCTNASRTNCTTKETTSQGLPRVRFRILGTFLAGFSHVGNSQFFFVRELASVGLRGNPSRGN